MSQAEGNAAPLDYAPAGDEPPKGALLTIFMIVFVDLLGFGIIIPLLPRYIPDFTAHPLKVTLLFSVFSICQFVGAPILGVLSDRYGRRPVLVISQFGSAVGYLLLGIATTFDWPHPGTRLILVYVSRVLDGFTGGNISTAQAYVSDVTTPQNRAKGMGVLGAAFGIGFTAGPFLGGFLGHYNVSWPAYVAAAASAAAAVLTLALLKETRVHKPTEAEVWLHPSRFRPVLRRPVLVQLLAVSFLIMAAFVMMESTITMFLDARFGFKEKEVGLFFGFVGIIIVAVQGGLIGRLTKKAGEWNLAIAGCVLVAAGMAGFLWTGYRPLLWVLLAAGAVNAIGRSLQQPTISSLLSKFSDPRDQGVVFGLFHGLGSLARVLGPVIAGFAYPYLNHGGQFLTAGVIAVAMGLWTAALRQPAPGDAASDAMQEGALEMG
jgi:DHA1 family tetracycline resistance protein-like MFS transporter